MNPTPQRLQDLRVSNPPQRESPAQRREKVAQLALLGLGVAAIAARLGLRRTTIIRDLDLIQKEWVTAASKELPDWKARELARIDALERQYWEAWERSQAAHAQVAEEPSEEPPARRRATLKAPVGDPRFLAGIEWCIDRRCKLLGLDSSKKTDAESLDTVKYVAGINWDEL